MENDNDRAVDHLMKELERLLRRFRLEYSISYAAAVGSLVITAMDLCREVLEDQEEDDG